MKTSILKEIYIFNCNINIFLSFYSFNKRLSNFYKECLL